MNTKSQHGKKVICWCSATKRVIIINGIMLYNLKQLAEKIFECSHPKETMCLR